MNSTPKRRGRKRKQDLIPIENDASESDMKISPDSTSKRGRKRKQINYYELANPGTFENAINNDLSDADDSKPLQSSVSVVVKPAKNKVSAKIALNEKNSESLKNEENTAKVSESNGHSKTTDDQHSDNNFDSASVDSSNERVLQNDQDSLSEQAKKAQSASGDKKYNYTGETVKMLSNLFKSFTPKKDEEMSNNNVASEKTESANTKKQNKSKNEEKPTHSNSENVVCAVCNQSIEKTLWLHHKQRFHNNLAWRIGDEPLDLSDQSFVMYTLNALYKKKKPLYCDKCGEAKKSVVGFLSHQTTCSKTDAQLDSVKISCELCGKKMLPVSMLTHMKFVHSSKKEKHKDEPLKTKNESKSLPSKRSAAKKALKMIETFSKKDSNEESHFSSDLNFQSQQFAVDFFNQELETNQIVECPFKCDFESRELSEVYKHCEGCSKKPAEGFVCKTCLLIVSSLKEIIFHVESVHNIVVNPEDEEEEECEKDQKHPSFLRTSVSKSEKRLCPFSFSWTTKFQNENFSELLYANFTQNSVDWPVLPASSALDYLPKLSESCDVAQLSTTSFINALDKQYEFRKYEIFETQQHADKKLSIFCGGPVIAMAWLPIPAHLEGENQILAVSVLQSPDEKYLTTQNSSVRSAIQFWSFGRLGNKSGSDCEPKLVFNLAHSHGPVWHMEWCPSGCYNKERRMGLLAATGADSVVYIYSVPFLENLGIYYKPAPVMKLMLQRCNNGLFGGTEYYPVKISWTKAKKHSFVAVGYTNGQVAIFNLNTNSIFSKYHDQAGVVCLLPEKNFQAHSHAITILQLHHLNEGCRWLLSGSLDRGVSLWDLEDHNYPVFSARKNIVTAGLWLTHWLCYVNGADEGSTSLYVSGALKQMREYITDTSVSLTFSPSSILTMSGSDWLNAVVHGNSAGEMIAVFPHQLLYLQSYTKLWKKKRLLFGYTSLVDKTRTVEERVEDDKRAKKLVQGSAGKQNGSKTSKLSKQSSEIQETLCNEPLVYEEAQKRYGLVFCDNKMETFGDFPESTTNQLTSYSKFLTITKPNQYPMTAINQILFNPNRQSSLYYAAGYQAGFVRISWMEFLKNDTEIH